jgi:hypothetical protein
MCKCTPEIRTPFCGKPGCEWPHKKKPEGARDQPTEHRCAAGFKLPDNGARCVVCGADRGDTCVVWVQRMSAAEKIVAEQANDERLWFRPAYITEDYLQKELRRLHAAIEGKSPEECAAAVLQPHPRGDGAR